MQIQHNWFHYS